MSSSGNDEVRRQWGERIRTSQRTVSLCAVSVPPTVSFEPSAGSLGGSPSEELIERFPVLIRPTGFSEHLGVHLCLAAGNHARFPEDAC